MNNVKFKINLINIKIKEYKYYLKDLKAIIDYYDQDEDYGNQIKTVNTIDFGQFK
jgi:hypothetical protein